MSKTSENLVATPPERTIAEQIERTLASGILRGERVPGARLPSVRALAVQFEVTVPTIQRALDRLGRTGLVTAKRGSGFTVNDPRRNMNLSLIPLWFEALYDQPEKSAKILRDFLELRRVLTAHLFEQSSTDLLAALPEMALAARTLTTSSDLREIALADAQLTRVVVEKIDNVALKAFFYTVQTLALEVPHIAEALYGDRAAHQAVINQVVASFAMSDRGEASLALQGAFETWDQLTVATYEARVRASHSISNLEFQ